MALPLILRLSPEYDCWPTWDDATGECLDPVQLGLPPSLIERIRQWDDLFQASLDHDDPINSRFPDEAAEAAWRAEGEAVFRTLIGLLGANRVRRGREF